MEVTGVAAQSKDEQKTGTKEELAKRSYIPVIVGNTRLVDSWTKVASVTALDVTETTLLPVRPDSQSDALYKSGLSPD
jgi:hypothetical protein